MLVPDGWRYMLSLLMMIADGMLASAMPLLLWSPATLEARLWREKMTPSLVAAAACGLSAGHAD